MRRQWIPWAVVGGIVLALELLGYFRQGDWWWTLSRVVWWLDGRVDRLGLIVGAVMVWTWLHWFARPKASGGGDEA